MSNQPQCNDPIQALQRLCDPAVQGAMQSDAELLTLFVESGSRAAAEAIVHRYAATVASVCRCTVSDPVSAEDAFQATFLVLLKSAKKIQNRRSVAAWLHGVAFRTACRLRKQRQAHVTEQSPDEVIALNQDDDQFNVLARKLELEALDQELEKLPAPIREILVEHYLLGYTAPQIADRTSLSLSAVEGRIRRGRYALLRQLAKRGISLSVIVAASTWFQQHLQATEAQAWTDAFLDAHLSPDAAPGDTDEQTGSNNAAQKHKKSSLDPSPDIASLVYGELNMFSNSLIKVVCSTAAVMLVGGLLSFNLYGEGSRASIGRSDSGEANAELPSLPAEAPMVVAQLGGFGVSPAVRPPEQTTAPTTASPAEPQTPPTPQVTTAKPTATTNSGQSTPQANAKSAEPRKPVEWKTPDTAPPTWLKDGLDELEQQERELRDLVRSKMRTKVDVSFQGVALKAAAEELSQQSGITILLNEVELGAAGIDSDTPVTMEGIMSVREFLRRLFDTLPERCAYTVRENSIEITSAEDADSDPAIRYYDLAFVLPNDSHLESVIQAIQSSIDSDTWVESGGTNSISIVGSMLIISCPEVLHQKIEIMLARIAAMNKENLEVAPPRRTPEYSQGMGGGMGGMGGGMF